MAKNVLRGSMPPKLINDVIRYVMAKHGVTQRKMAEILGMREATSVGARLNCNNMSFDRALEMLEVCGYEVVVQPRRDKRPDDQILVYRSDANVKGGASE